MNKGAVLHIPLSQYAYAEGEHELTIRLRTEKNDIKRCILFYGDRADPTEPIAVKELPMQKAATDDLFDYYEAGVRDIYTRVCYYFLLDDGREQTYYYGRNFCGEMTCGRTEYFQFPYIRREDIIDIPAWAKDIVMYHIFPDSFASGRRALEGAGKRMTLDDGTDVESNLGGTLSGVKENLDYLKALGVNCIYLNPVFAANSYHKYDTIDYFSVDPCFGGLSDLKELVRECHKRGVRVILDGVFNHCGPDFFAFRDVLEKGKASKYYDWFYYMPEPVEYTDPPSYEAFAYVKEMPKLNTGNQGVAEYLCSVGTYWIKEADIDGWRLDVANEINHDFWRMFRREVRKAKPDVFLIGEIWEDAGCWLSGDQFDSTMNYTFSYLCRDFFAKGVMCASEFDAQIQRMIMRYPWSVALAQMNFLDSHDVPRFLSYCGGDRRKMELAFFYLFMGVGVPSIFYGDECYIEGMAECEYRKAMPWNGKEDCAGTIGQWSAIRREHSVLRRGNYRCVYRADEQGGYGFIREDEEETLLILLHNGDGEHVIETERLRELLAGTRTDSAAAAVICGAQSGDRMAVVETDMAESGWQFTDLSNGKKAEEQILLGAYEGRVFRITTPQ